MIYGDDSMELENNYETNKLFLAALSSSWSLVVCRSVGLSVGWSVGNVCEKVTFRVSKDY